MTRALRLTPEQFKALAGRLDGPAPRRSTRTAHRQTRRGGHSALVASVVELLNLLPEVAWAHKFNTGQMRSPDGARVIRFSFVGCADVLGQMATGEFLAVECKTENDYPTTEQLAFLGHVDRAGGCAGWVRNTAQVSRLVRGFMAQRANREKR